MFTKKNMIVIALIAIFVMGAVVLQALEYDVCVHVTGNAAQIQYQIPIGGGWQGYQVSWVGYVRQIDGPYPTNCKFRAVAAGYPAYTDEYSIGQLDPDNVNHFYLIIDGSAEEDKTIPGNQ